MKKFAMATAAVAALGAGVAQAYTVGTFSNGLVVPNVIHNGEGDTTAVGLINQSGADRAVYWTFFDENSHALSSGCFKMGDRAFHPFIWAVESGSGMSGQRGYLVFALGETAGTPGVPGVPAVAAVPAVPAVPAGRLPATPAIPAIPAIPAVAAIPAIPAVPAVPHLDCADTATLAGVGDPSRISASAFQVNIASKSVSYVPVIDGPLTLAAAATDLTRLDQGSLTGVAGAADLAAANAADQTRFHMRYATSPDIDTSVVVWSTADHRGTYTVDAYDDNKENRRRVNLGLKKGHLDVFDPKTIPDRSDASADGFIEWVPRNGGVAPRDMAGLGGTAANALAVVGGSVFTYSIIESSDMGAVQTILGAHR